MPRNQLSGRTVGALVYGGRGYRRSAREGQGDLVQLPALPQDGVHVAGAGEDRRGLTVLFWSNVNRYGTFRLDTDKRLNLAPVADP
ncbi:hypothetical protein [Streptomyces sp. NPDC050121]|uniref:hypothetical protein n=1 Tax=Streptomyces sp. NPDC050121 TaxID=3365601 RepID=UPI00378C4742